MNIAAYGRVSTDKSGQLNSFEAQKEFFLEYTKPAVNNLIKYMQMKGFPELKSRIVRNFNVCLQMRKKDVFRILSLAMTKRLVITLIFLLMRTKKKQSRRYFSGT